MKYINREKTLGVILCIITAYLAMLLSSYFGTYVLGFEKSPISPIIISIIIGIIISNLIFPNISHLKNGFDYCIKVFLKLGIILLGIRLSLIDLLQYGSKGLIIVIPCIITTIVLVQYLGRKFNISRNLSLLIAVVQVFAVQPLL